MKKIIAILIVCSFLLSFPAYADDTLAKNIGLLVLQISKLQNTVKILEKENELLRQKLLEATEKIKGEDNGMD